MVVAVFHLALTSFNDDSDIATGMCGAIKFPLKSFILVYDGVNPIRHSLAFDNRAIPAKPIIPEVETANGRFDCVDSPVNLDCGEAVKRVPRVERLAAVNDDVEDWRFFFIQKFLLVCTA